MLYDWLYVVCSSDYSFLEMVSAKLLSMIYMYLGFGKGGFVKCLLNGEHYKKSGNEVLREEIFKKIKALFSV